MAPVCKNCGHTKFTHRDMLKLVDNQVVYDTGCWFNAETPGELWRCPCEKWEDG